MPTNDNHDEFIRFQAETKVRMNNIEKTQDCQQEQIDGIVEAQNEFKVSLGRLTLYASFGALAGTSLVTILWSLGKHLLHL